MIPKIIHYCWFGGGQLSDLENNCISSWSSILSDFQIIRWDESNFPIDKYPYVCAAYKAKKWAFVSDYVRVWALYKFGGIYLDTDYKILKTLDNLLDKKFFCGAENDEYVGTAIIGSEKGNWLLKKMLDYYDNNKFEISNGKYNMIPNTMIITDILAEKGYHRGESEEIYKIYIAPKETFYPGSNKKIYGDETYGIHFFRGSWWSEKERNRANSNVYKKVVRPVLIHAKKWMRDFLGVERARRIEIKIKNILK